MNTVSITIELCKEDRARLDAISAALERLAQPQAVNELTGAVEPISRPEPAAEAEELTSREIFSANLAALIDERCIVQKDLAEALGVGTSTVNDWVHGKKYPRIDVLEKMAKYFEVTITDLVSVVPAAPQPQQAPAAPDPEPEPQPQRAPADPDPEPAADMQASKYTKTDLQHKVVELSTKGKKGEAREIIQAYGAKLSDVSPDKYDEIMEKLEQLEG